MTPISKILALVRHAYRDRVEIKYVYPNLYIVCVDQAFEGLEEGQRWDKFIKTIEIESDQTFDIGSIINIVLVTPDERKRDYDFLDGPTPGQHWLPFFDDQLPNQDPIESDIVHSIHFYGYKGGQARSTVLAMLGRQFADDGYRVLVVDADIEAPSLDILLNAGATNLNQSLMGLLSEISINPISAYSSSTNDGCLDLLACRPMGKEWDMDFAAFALQTSLDATALENATQKLREWVLGTELNPRYDIVLFDHRSGISTSVLPIIKGYPGPVVVCLRGDDQSNNATSIFDILFSQVKQTPGAFVSFSLDPEATRDQLLRNNSANIFKLLDRLGKAIERGSIDYSGDEDIPPEDFIQYWVTWFHDRAFLNSRFPRLEEISDDNRQSLLQLREVLGFLGPKSSSDRKGETSTTKLSPSGASDEGYFIETPEIARLFQENTPITYIFGRKGTGKTRLLRELQHRRLGEPLVVAADEKNGGLPTNDALFSDLANRFTSNPELLWWCILGAALDTEDTSSAKFQKNVVKWSLLIKKTKFQISKIANLAKAMTKRRVFLIDGIETAFRSDLLIKFIESLFKFLLTVQSDAHFSDKVVIRLFLRVDLARKGFQNLEQQTAQRRLDLSWNTQSIFNFVLSRIIQLEWFKSNFESACKSISKHKNKIGTGVLPSTEYEPLLMKIFPQKIKRNNLQTLTFLKTYFSDAAGGDETRAAFYPRLFDTFLREIVEQSSRQGTNEPIEDGRIYQGLILDAHDSASKKFLDEVKQELSVVLNLGKDKNENDQRVTDLLNAFDGLKTPFELDECIVALSSKIKITRPKLRDTLILMKEVGMFEERPAFPGWWRAGRLFKSALRMKYVRQSVNS